MTTTENWIGHVLRGNDLLGDVIQGRVMGRKRTDKPRKVMISDLKEAFSKKKDEKSDPGKREIKRRRDTSDGHAEMKRMA